MISATNDTKSFFENECSPIYIYGAGDYGTWTARFMQKCGMHFEGFIDKAAEGKDKVFVLGKKVLHPEMLRSLPKMRLRIIIATLQADGVLAELPLYTENIDAVCMVPIYENLFSDGKKYNINIFLSYFRAKLIKVDVPTILSNRCTAGFIYRALGTGMLSPTINTGISWEGFMKICRNPKEYLSEDMVFAYWTKALNGIRPVGRLKDVEVLFGHEEDETQAIHRWNRMRKWINWNNVIYVMSDTRPAPFNTVLPYRLAEEFCSLKEKHLLLMNQYLYAGKKLPGCMYVENIYFHDEEKVIESWFDLLGWINGEYEL